MTEELKKWVQSNRDEAVSYQTPNEEVRFWLSAFVRLVREEAKQIACTCKLSVALNEDPCSDCLVDAYRFVCQKFGLERK